MTTFANNLVSGITSLCDFVTIPTSTYISTATNQACRTSKIDSTNYDYVSVTNPETFTVAQTIATVTTPEIQSPIATISLGNNATTMNMLNSGTLTMNGLLQYPMVSVLPAYSYKNLMLSYQSTTTKIQRQTSAIVVANTITPFVYPVAFITAPVVLATANGGSGVRVNISAITNNGFNVICSGTSFNWIALGS